MFKNNRTLMHVDFSNNGLCAEDCKEMQEGLRQNHAILGLHMGGNNEKDVDAQGHIIALSNKDPAANHILTRIHHSLDHRKPVSQGILDIQVTSNCWICEGWTQVQFKFDPLDLSQSTLDELGEINENTFCYLHLSIDEFKGDLMEKSDNGQFNLMRMIPPKKVEYYYSLVDAPLAKQDKS